MIALTQGQVRRRLISRARAALWAMPWWIILMGLLFKADKLLIRGGLILMGTCADCCGSSGCSGCVSASLCSNCNGGAAGDTPSQFTITFTGVGNAFPCTNCGAGFYSAGTGVLDGTYTLTQAASCGWHTGSIASPTYWVDTGSCTHTGTQATTMDISLGVTPTTLDLEVIGNIGVACWFTGSAANAGCCASTTVSNSQVAYICGGPHGANVGINGSAVITAC